MTEPDGRGWIEVASVMCKSEPQMPQLQTFRMSSFGPHFGRSMVSTTRGLPTSLKTAARMVSTSVVNEAVG
jgi:hypothetical protein